MKRKAYGILTGLGMVVLLGGLLAYGFGWHKSLSFPRPDLFPWATSVLGCIMLICGACELFSKKTEEMKIEEQDERNCMLANMAKASAYEVMTVLFSVLLLSLSLLGYLSETVFFCFAGMLVVVQLVFVLRLWYLQKTR